MRVTSIPKLLGFALSTIAITDAAALADDVPNNGEDFTRPPARFDFRYQFEEKSAGTAQDTFILRMDRPISLGDGWKLATRLDVPFVLGDGSSRDNPGGRYGFGTGDVLIQAALIDEFSKRWAAGAGPRLTLPTASQDQFGSGKVQLGPIGGIRYMLPEVSSGSFVEFVARYDCDLGGYGGRSHVSRLACSPTVNFALPRDWFVTLFPSQDITTNFLGGAKWFIPLDILVGKNLTKRTVASVEVSVPVVKQFVLYEVKMEARLSYFF